VNSATAIAQRGPLRRFASAMHDDLATGIHRLGLGARRPLFFIFINNGDGVACA
jgi:hypothetical protein